MGDKVGIGFALNRIGICLYHQNKFRESLKFNLKCLDIIDEENIYAVFYNRGITLRKVKDYANSITFFNKALRWAHQRNDFESKCFIFG